MVKISLKAARANSGMTLKKAADNLGVTVDTLSSWENGKTYPTIPHLKNIERLYQVSYNDLTFLI